MCRGGGNEVPAGNGLIIVVIGRAKLPAQSGLLVEDDETMSGEVKKPGIEQSFTRTEEGQPDPGLPRTPQRTSGCGDNGGVRVLAMNSSHASEGRKTIILAVL